jgi:hypothetical protein
MWPWPEASSCTTGCASALSTRRGWVGTSAGRGDCKQRRQRPACGDAEIYAHLGVLRHVSYKGAPYGFYTALEELLEFFSVLSHAI